MHIVYIDSVFLLNFIINYLLLLATAKICGTHIHRGRIVCGALAGALYAAAVWLPGLEGLGSVFGKLLSAAVIIAAAFLKRRQRRLLRLGLVFLSVSLALGGGVYAAGLLVYGRAPPGGVPSLPIDFKTLFLTAALSYALLTLVFRRAALHTPRETRPVTIRHQGRSCRLSALSDSGHTLQDPVTGAAVLILDRAMAEELLDMALPAEILQNPAESVHQWTDWPVRLRLIPYAAVGVRQGFLLAFKPDGIIVGKTAQKNMLVALSPNPVSDGGGYQALIPVL